MKIVGLLLAAGSATRFGSDKLRHELPHGVWIAVQAARHLLPEVSRVIAVVRPGQDELLQNLKKEGCEVVVCDNAADGMGASLACAARAAAHFSPNADGYLVALGDMPFVRRSSIAAVRDALASGAKLAAPYFRSRRGHPVGIAAEFYPILLSLKADEGARQLVGRNESRMVKIPVGDPGVIRDIDRPEDLTPPLRV